MSENIPSIYRMIIPVSDSAKAVSFYTQLLGIDGRSVGGGRYYFACGHVILALIDSKKPPLPEYIYFAVADVESVYERAKALDCLSAEMIHGAAGGEIITRPWGERCFYVFDPFGNGLCFVDEKTLFTGH